MVGGIIRISRAIPGHALKLTRYLSLYSGNCKQKEKELEGTFVPVYNFPYIVPFSIINRLKIYQTGLASIGIPLAASLNKFNYISSGAVEFTAAFGITGCIALYSLGFLTQNLIGVIYYNEERDIIKISYSDFWGRRKDVEVPKNDVVPLNELPVMPFDKLFLTFRRLSTEETLKLNLTLGVILDKEKIKQIL